MRILILFILFVNISNAQTFDSVISINPSYSIKHTHPIYEFKDESKKELKDEIDLLNGRLDLIKIMELICLTTSNNYRQYKKCIINKINIE